MALPPKEMNTTCLRCHTSLALDMQNCPTCGANRDVELAVAAELNPAIAALQKLLGVVGTLTLALGLITYQHLQGLVSSSLVWSLAGPSLAAGATMLVLCALARKAPLPVAMFSLVLFVGGWFMETLSDPVAGLTPGIGLGVRVFITVVLFVAVKSALKAKRIRADANARFPDARVLRS